MKTFYITIFFFLIAFSTIYTQNVWEKANGLESIKIYSLAVNSNGDIFAGTDSSGLFRSTDNGNSWVNIGFTNTWIHTNGIVINPSQEILVAVDNKDATGGVLRSTNNGNDWDTLGLTNNAEIAIALNSIGNIFVGTAAQGVYRSTDNGQNFVQINQGLDTSNGMNPVSFAINTSGHIYLGTLSGGVFRSTDNGDNWTQINQGITNTQILSLIINSNGNIFAGTSGGGVFRSADNGASWVQINQGLFGQNGQGLYVFSLAINSNGDIFAGTGDGVFLSTDNGNNWVETNQGLTSIGVLSMAINSNGGVFAGTVNGVFRSVITANLKVYLQGAYSGGGIMTTTLNSNNLIPLNSNTAYSTLNYSYIASTVTSIPSADIVDWVLVELRTGTSSGTKVTARAGFLKNDGTVVDTNGTSPLQFAGLGEGNYYVVVRHRNHLAIMSASAISLSHNSVLYDFSTTQSQAYGTNPTILLSGGVFGLYSGDSNKDGQITALDFNTWNVNTKSGQTGYVTDDINLDGQVTALDFNFWNVNTKLGAISNVP